MRICWDSLSPSMAFNNLKFIQRFPVIFDIHSLQPFALQGFAEAFANQDGHDDSVQCKFDRYVRSHRLFLALYDNVHATKK